MSIKANHLVYVAENVGDNPERGLKYVGKTNDFERRRAGHKTQAINAVSKNKFHAALRKWGWDSFEWTIVKDGMREGEAMDHEVDTISELGTFGDKGYNMSPGGKDVFSADALLPATRKKRAMSDPDYRERMSRAAKKAYEDPEFKKRVSQAMKKHYA